jgi:Methyltransferase domain
VSGLFKWGGQKDGGATATGPAPPDVLTTSKVFRKFIGALAHAPAPVILDLGPVVGANITYFGDRLACKIYVEDLFAEVETATRKGTRDALGQTLVGRLAHEDASVDGILAWDLFDFLDQATGKALAPKLTKLLRPGGALYGLFGTTPVDLGHYTRFVVESEETLRLRPYPATAVRRHVLLNRDINKMFDGLNVAEAVLLKTSTRETLFRKP